MADGGVVAGSDRRAGTAAAWVYDVSALAWPSAAELQKAADPAKQIAFVQAACDQFLAGVRSTLKTADAAALVWFGPGQLLVIGSPHTHEAAATLFANLADAKFQPPADLAQLHAVTRQRAKDGQAESARRRAVRRQAQTAAAYAEYGWRLLAAAADGRLDLEALTELQIAWKTPEPLLAGEGTILALRSVWQISEAARTLPQEAELQAARRYGPAEIARCDRCRPGRPGHQARRCGRVFPRAVRHAGPGQRLPLVRQGRAVAHPLHRGRFAVEYRPAPRGGAICNRPPRSTGPRCRH